MRKLRLGTREIRMTEGPIFVNFIGFILPIMLGTFLQTLYNAADMAVVSVSPEGGAQAVGAVSATTIICSLIVNVFTGISTGSGVVAAYYVGAKDDENLHRTVQTAMFFSMILGGFLLAVGEITAVPLLRLTACPEDVFDQSLLYLRIYYVSIPFSAVYNFGASVLRAHGDSRRPLLFMALSGFCNVALNFLTVLAFGMGVAGVSLATVVSSGISAAMVLGALGKQKDGCAFRFREFLIDWKKLGRVLAIGVPASLQSILYSVSNLQIQSAINGFGSAAVAGNGACGSLEGISGSILVSITAGTTTFVGQNRGAHKPDRVRRTVRVASLSGVLICGGVAACVWLLRAPLLSLFLHTEPGTDPAYIAAAREVADLRATHLLLMYGVAALKDIMDSAQRGLGVSVPNTAISVVGVVVWRVLWMAFVYPHFETIDNLYLCYNFSWGVTALGMTLCYFIVSRRYFRCERAHGV